MKIDKKLLSNFFFLSLLQITNYIFPIITFPYLVRVLGIERFGLLAFATAVIAYFNIFVDYGFNLTATKEVSIHRNDKQKLNEIFSSVLIIKSIFLVISFIILTVIVFSFTKFKEHYIIYYLTFGTVLGHVLFPQWFFQGLEQMKYITLMNILSKMIYTISIFIFIHTANDVWKVPLLNSLGFILAGMVALSIIKKDFEIDFILPNIQILKRYILEGWHIFLSNVAISLYTISTIFILGLFTNNIIVGYYAAADKIRSAFQGILGPISQTIYPHIVHKVKISKEQAIKFIRNAAILISILGTTLSLVLFLFADFWVELFLGEKYTRSIAVLQIIAFLPLIVGLSNIFGIQTMVTFGMKKHFSKVIILGSILNIILSIILVPLYFEIGSAISVITVETFITILMFIILRKNGIDLLKGKVYV